MRVISGLYKGRKLLTVNDHSVRPATDRVRQTIFDVLATRLDLEGAKVLDLFAGSGSLGIESLSRGAAHATFVESGREAALYIERNLETLGCASSADVLAMDALGFLQLASGGDFELIFADPPYTFARTAEIPGLVFGAGMVRAGGYLVIEHAHNLAFEGTAAYRVGPVKKFGRTLVSFFQPTQGRSTAS
jgi:16S rRNA (guanine966-N2)-methyltransferase